MKAFGWIFSVLCALAVSSVALGAAPSPDEAKIRSIVLEMMKEKEQQIGGLEQRVKELEALAKSQKDTIDQLKAEKSRTAEASKGGDGGEAGSKQAAAVAAKPESPLAKLILPSLRKKDEAAKAEAEEAESGPKVGGWMEMTARTKNGDNTVFNLGVVELDLDKIVESKHFAASAALDWFPYGVSPNAQIGVGLVDFHLYDDAVPVRGRIFQEPGFHLQLGQFDLPFAADYQYFAAKDRITVTPPMTTTRMQMSGISNPANGGFNSTGVRSYGSWNNFNYAVYWVESLYDANPSFQGGAAGGRVGYAFKNPYRLHKRSDLPIFDIGLSTLVDMDRRDHTGDKVYALDMSMSYGAFRIINEFLLHDASQNRNGATIGLADEYGFHNTLVVNLEDWLKVPLKAFGRYQEWRPKYDFIVGEDIYRVRPLRSISIGLNYQLNNFVQMKLEYNDSLGTYTDEPSFQRRYGIAELVATF
jgi:TolA-binding protein